MLVHKLAILHTYLYGTFMLSIVCGNDIHKGSGIYYPLCMAVVFITHSVWQWYLLPTLYGSGIYYPLCMAVVFITHSVWQ